MTIKAFGKLSIIVFQNCKPTSSIFAKHVLLNSLWPFYNYFMCTARSLNGVSEGEWGVQTPIYLKYDSRDFSKSDRKIFKSGVPRICESVKSMLQKFSPGYTTKIMEQIYLDSLSSNSTLDSPLPHLSMLFCREILVKGFSSHQA